MRKVLYILVFLTSTVGLRAQQDAQFSQNMFLNPSINPGATGMKGQHCFDLVSRQSWLGFEGAPFTGFLSYNAPFSPIANTGIGGVLIFDQIGFNTRLGLKMNFAYHLTLGEGKLGIGMDVGMLRHTLSPDWTSQPGVDPLLVNSNKASGSAIGVDLGFGLFYSIPNKLYFGISGLKLVPNQQFMINGSPTELKSHIYLTAGYNHPITNDIDLKPNLLVKTDLASTQLDVNLTAEYQKSIWLGASYRIQDAVVANVGYYMPLDKEDPSKKLKIGIAYDFTTSLLKNNGDFQGQEPSSLFNTQIGGSNRSVGSIELYLGYCFIVPPKPNFKKYVDPLFL